MQADNEFLIKVYQDGNMRLPAKIRKQLSIVKGSSLIVKIDDDGSINIQTSNHKLDTIRAKIKQQLGKKCKLVDEFLQFKKSDDSY
jgi:bifunctional DNA-binding transcriptional regulator/antitoxin component of YhaV-PrlF toxin-antitoxin module